MKTRVYGSWQERTAELLWGRLGKMTLITDEDGKPLRYEKVYPPLKKLVQNCKKEKIKLPETPEIKDILLAMVEAGHTNPQTEPSAAQAIKSLSERVFEKAIKDAGFSQEKVDFKIKEPPPDQEETAIEQAERDSQAKAAAEEAEDAKLEAQKAKVVLEQARSEAEHAKNEAEEARVDTERAEIKIQQLQIEAKQVELQAERDELQEEPENSPNKAARLDKNESEQDKLVAEQESLAKHLAILEAATKKKSSPPNKEAKK